jgi:hypothetical protein
VYRIVSRRTHHTACNEKHLDRLRFVCARGYFTHSSHQLVFCLCYQFFRRLPSRRRPLLSQPMQDCLPLLPKLHNLGHAVSAWYKHCLCASREGVRRLIA